MSEKETIKLLRKENEEMRAKIAQLLQGDATGIGGASEQLSKALGGIMPKISELQAKIKNGDLYGQVEAKDSISVNGHKGSVTLMNNGNVVLNFEDSLYARQYFNMIRAQWR